MNFSFHKKFFFLIVLLLSNSSFFAQNDNVTFDWGTVEYSITSTFIKIEKIGENSFTFDVAKDKKQTSFILNIFIKELQKDRKKGLKLIFKSNWIKKGTCIVPEPTPCKEIVISKRLFFDVLKNGKQTLNIGFADVKPNLDCSLVRKPDNYLKIDFEIRGLKEDSIVIPLSEEDQFWGSCYDPFAKIDCLQEYLKKYPNGKYLTKAKNTLESYDVQKFKQCSEEYSKESKESIGFEKATLACQNYLDHFEKGSYVGKNVKNAKKILEDIALYSKRIDEIDKPPELKSEPVDTVQLELPIEQYQPPKISPDMVDENDLKNQVGEVPLEESALEEIEWQEAQKVNTAQSYHNYWKNFPNSKHATTAKRNFINYSKISIQRNISEGNKYSFTIKNVFQLQVDSIVPKAAFEPSIKKTGKHSFEVNIETPDERNYIIYFSDSLKPSGINTFNIDLDNFLDAVLSFSNDGIEIEFKNGNPEFQIYFINEDDVVVYSEKTRKTTWTATMSELENNIKTAGEYTISVSDKGLTSPLTKYEWEKLTIEPQSKYWQYIIIAASLLILFIFFFLVLGRNIKKKRGESELESFRDSRREALIHLHEREIKPELWLEKNVTEHSTQNKSNVTPAVQNVTPIMKENEGKTNGIKIKGLRQSAKKVLQYSQESQLTALLKDCIFSFDPRVHWQDSIIKTIYFNQRSVKSLDQFLINQNLKPLQEKEGMVPEIGGILLGRPAQCALDKKYIVIVEKFVPINPEHHSVFKIEFSTQSLVKDLGDIQDQYPELITVGWFHTHPGHGLFLSKPDLTIQEKFFGEPYQFAMEIDSLTKKLDTGFFTQTQRGEINNSSSKKGTTSWFSWLENVESLNKI